MTMYDLVHSLANAYHYRSHADEYGRNKAAIEFNVKHNYNFGKEFDEAIKGKKDEDIMFFIDSAANEYSQLIQEKVSNKYPDIFDDSSDGVFFAGRNSGWLVLLLINDIYDIEKLSEYNRHKAAFAYAERIVKKYIEDYKKWVNKNASKI